MTIDSSEMLPDCQKLGGNPPAEIQKTHAGFRYWFPVHPVCECGFDRLVHIALRNTVVLGIIPNTVFFSKNNADNSGNLRRLVLDEGLH